MRIYVGNLSYEATEQQLRDAFGAHGEVVDVMIMRDRQTGRARGFAFISFATQDQADRAIEQMRGYEINGRAIICNPATPRSNDDDASSDDHHDQSVGRSDGGKQHGCGGSVANVPLRPDGQPAGYTSRDGRRVHAGEMSEPEDSDGPMDQIRGGYRRGNAQD